MRLPPPLLGLSPGTLRVADVPRFLASALRAAEGGLEGILLREEGLPDGPFLALARGLVEAGLALTLGDRVHLVEAARADGVFLAHHSLRTQEARSLLPAGAFLGLSDHGPPDGRDLAGADGRSLAPFGTVPGKGAPLGIKGLAACLLDSSLPTWALGGISLHDLPALARLPLRGVIVGRGLAWWGDSGAAARALRAAWRSAENGSRGGIQEGPG